MSESDAPDRLDRLVSDSLKVRHRLQQIAELRLSRILARLQPLDHPNASLELIKLIDHLEDFDSCMECG